MCDCQYKATMSYYASALTQGMLRACPLVLQIAGRGRCATTTTTTGVRGASTAVAATRCLHVAPRRALHAVTALWGAHTSTGAYAPVPKTRCHGH
jgi:hypothetical protein